MSTDLPSDAPDPPVRKTPSLRPPWRRWIEVGVIVGIPLLLIALLIPAAQRARDAARKTSNKCHLKQIGNALHNYQETHGTLPPGGTFGGDGTAYHGWMTRILPFIDGAPLYNRLDLNVPWDHPLNSQHLIGQLNSTYSTPFPEPNWTVEGWPLAYYAGNPDLLYRNSSVSIEEIEEGTSYTWVAGDISGDLTPWPYPYNWRPMGSDLKGGEGFGRPPNFAFVLFLDGSVHGVGDQLVPEFLESAATVSAKIRAWRGEPTTAQTDRPDVKFAVTKRPPQPPSPVVNPAQPIPNEAPAIPVAKESRPCG